MTDAQLRDQAVALLKATSVTYPVWAKLLAAGAYNPKDGSATNWGKAFAALAQIGIVVPPPPPPSGPIPGWSSVWTFDATKATLDPQSAAKVAAFQSYAIGVGGGPYFAAGPAWAYAPAGTPTYPVPNQEGGNPGGVSPISTPIPPGTKPGCTNDMMLAIVDSDGVEWCLGNCGYDSATGKITGCYGEATVPKGDVLQTWPAGGSGNEGENSFLGPAIFPEDVASGVIAHAMSFNCPNVGPQASVYPANPKANNSGYAGNTGIGIGTWLRLDPAVNVASLGLSGLEEMFAVALQRYGMFLRDIGPSDMSIYLTDETNRGGNGVVWPKVGVPLPLRTQPTAPWAPNTQYAQQVAKNFPWDRLQVLQPPAH